MNSNANQSGDWKGPATTALKVVAIVAETVARIIVIMSKKG